MMRTTRQHTPAAAVVSAASLLLVLSACGVEDEEFPSSQLEIIVPWDAGGGTDMATRQLASAAEDTCGVRIIVSNQSGAAGATGHQAMADAEPDGYTLGAATIEISILEHLGAAEVTPHDLHGVLQFQSSPAVIAVADDAPYENVADLIQAMEDGESVRVATNGTGGMWDIAAGGLELETGLSFAERVPFDGGPGMVQATLSGDTEVLTPSGAEILGHIESGDLRALAVMSDERLAVLPDVPTLPEEGIDWTAANWFGLVVPQETPQDRVDALSDCFLEAAQSEAFEDYMEGQGFPIVLREAAEFEPFMDEEYEHYGDVVNRIY